MNTYANNLNDMEENGPNLMGLNTQDYQGNVPDTMGFRNNKYAKHNRLENENSLNGSPDMRVNHILAQEEEKIMKQ